MAKKVIFTMGLFGAILIAFLIAYFLYGSFDRATSLQKEAFAVDLKNCSYIVEEELVSLKQGMAEGEIQGSSFKKTTRYFGNETTGDFNQDGFADAAFFITQNSGGSGTFYYAAAALGSAQGCKGTNVVYLGDRIAPQGAEFKNGNIIINYADRKEGDPMAAKPTVGISRYFKIRENALVEIEK